MKPLWILFFGLMVLSSALAKPAYEVTRSDRKFLADVLAAVERKDSAWIADHTFLPISLTTNGRRHLAEKKEFASAVARALTPELRARFQSEGKKAPLKNWKGVMVGDGILWFEQVRPSDASPWEYRIIAFGGFAFRSEEPNQHLRVTERGQSEGSGGGAKVSGGRRVRVTPPRLDGRLRSTN